MAGQSATLWRARKYACPDCHKKFRWLSSLKRHLRASAESTKVYCNECDYEAKSKGDLMSHKRIHAREKVYRYNERAAPAAPRTKFRIDRRVFVKESCYRGAESNYDATQSQVWRLLTNSRHRAFRCDGCGAMFSARRHLLRHINCMHGNPTHRNYSSASDGSSLN